MRRPRTGLSSWLAGAAAARLRGEALEEFLDAWEKKHGALTPAELSRAKRELGVGTAKKSRPRGRSSWTRLPSIIALRASGRLEPNGTAEQGPSAYWLTQSAAYPRTDHVRERIAAKIVAALAAA